MKNEVSSLDFGLESVLMANAPEVSSVAGNPKALGAYYTDSQVAEFLVWWAIRDRTDCVLDPSFGGGVFLRAASKRLRELDAEPGDRIFGIELDPDTHARISELLQREFGLPKTSLTRADFFDISQERQRPVDVVVGNPPFIRYQRFSGDTRKRALARAAEEGLKLNELVSSWLPFVVHSIGFLRPGGRLAMVVPFEIGHAAYARPVLEHLSKHFESVSFLTFRKKLFPDLSEDTLLLLAEGRHRRGGVSQFFIRDLEHAGGLAAIQRANRLPIAAMDSLDTIAVASGAERLIEAFIPRKARDLYRELRDGSSAIRLGELADVGIGYVTGANNFFHLSPDEARELRIPERFLRPCVRRGRALSGLRLTREDWKNLMDSGQTGYLLELPSEGRLPESVSSYLAKGRREGIHKAFKCRTRTPWYRVPHVYQPDAFLNYMSGDMPRLVANDAGVVAPNTLHIVRIHRDSQFTKDGIAALWQTSLTRLSVELEGHALGGGMLKLEPTEAGNVLLPFWAKKDKLEALAIELDQIARTKGGEPCLEHADQALLRRGLGLSAADVLLLRESGMLLRERRTSRNLMDERH